MCSFSSSSVLHPGTFESKWVKFQRVSSADFGICRSLRACLLVTVFDGVCLFFLRQILTLKSCSEKEVVFAAVTHCGEHRDWTLRVLQADFIPSLQQQSQRVRHAVSVVSASYFFLWFKNWNGGRGREETCFRQTIAKVQVVKGYRIEKETEWVRKKITTPTCWITFCQERWQGGLHNPYPPASASGGWSGEQGPGLLSSHLCSFQLPPCSLQRDENQHVPTLRFSLVTLTWTLIRSSLPFLLLPILCLPSFTCAEESPVLTHPDSSKVLSLPSPFPYSLPHRIHAKCN